MDKKEYIEWIKCNILEVVILILVLALVINAFSKEPTQIQEKDIEEAVTMEEQPPEGQGTVEVEEETPLEMEKTAEEEGQPEEKPPEEEVSEETEKAPE